MQIQCTKCEARYMVPEQSIGAAGRTVRCAKCQNQWFVAPVAGLEKPLAGLESIMAQAAATKPIPPGSNLPVIKYPSAPPGVMASVFGLLAVAVAVFLLAMWPALYGFPPSKGLALAEVNMLTRFDDKHPEIKRPIYEISGKIINKTDKTLDVPILRITLQDKEGQPLQYWDFSEKGRTLDAGKNIPFTTGQLDIKFKQPSRFIVELGNTMELALRSKPE